MESESSKSLVTIGGPIDRVKVCLRMFGDDLVPAEITRLLGCEPTESHVKGEIIVSAYSGRERIIKTGSWQLDSNEDESVSLEEQISILLERLNKDSEIWIGLSSKYQVDLFCGLFLEEENRGFWFSGELLRKLVDRGLSIGFDVYAWFGDSEEEEAL